MKRIILSGILMLSLLGFTTCGVTEQAPQIFASFIRANHPAPFGQLSEASFDVEIAQLDKQWEELLEAGEAGYRLRALAASLGDEHTLVDDASMMAQMMPFFVLPIEGHYVVVQAQQEYAELVGKTLESVGGVAIDTLCDRMTPYISAQTEGWKNEQVAQMLCSFRMLVRAGAGINGENIAVEVRDPMSGETISRTVEILYDGYDYRTSVLMEGIASTLLQNGYYRAWRLDEETLFIQYNVCANAEEMSMKQFVDTLQKQLGKALPQRVLVDLRHNDGGDSRVINPLLKLLKKWQKKGTKVIVLTGAGTFSSAVMAARDLRQIGGVLVGEPTGGVMGFGEVKTAELGDGLTLYCASKNFSGGKAHEPIMPDVEICQTVSDFVQGKDSAVEVAKAL